MYYLAGVEPTDPSTDRDLAPTVVVGAGIGGLLAAITAADLQPHRRVVVVDPHPPGGRARVDRRAGFTFNRGPRALYVDGEAERALRHVGVDTSHGGPAHLGGALAIAGGRAHRFPGGALDSARTSLFSVRQKAQVTRALAALWRAGDDDTAGRTLADWLDERALDLVVRQFVEALVRVSTYTDAPDDLAAGPALANARAGIRPGVRYLDGGWQTLVDRLVAIARARGVEIVSEAARQITTDDAMVRVVTDRTTWAATSAIVAVGTPEAAAALLPERPTAWRDLARPVTAACLELGVRGLPAHRFALGIDEPLYGSTHAPPADLAPPGHAVVHLMRYQRVGEDVPAAAQRARLEGLATQMGIASAAIVEARFLARMVVMGTVPTAATGGLAGRPPVAVEGHPGIHVVGDWVGPVGLLLDGVAASAVEAGRLAARRSATMGGA
jgi:phytoene dehydrogenase-like protein